MYNPSSVRRLTYAPFSSPWLRDWPIIMLMLHSLRARKHIASWDKFPLTPSKCFITASYPYFKPAVTPWPPKRSYNWRYTHSTSTYAAISAGWTTSAAVLAYSPHSFKGRTPTTILRPYDKRPTTSKDRRLCQPLQAQADPLMIPLLTILRNWSPYPLISLCSRCYSFITLSGGCGNSHGCSGIWEIDDIFLLGWVVSAS